MSFQFPGSVTRRCCLRAAVSAYARALSNCSPAAIFFPFEFRVIPGHEVVGAGRSVNSLGVDDRVVGECVIGQDHFGLRQRCHGVHQGTDDGPADLARSRRGARRAHHARPRVHRYGRRRRTGSRDMTGSLRSVVRGRLVRDARLVPPGPHQSVRALLHDRADHARWTGAARGDTGLDVVRDPGRVPGHRRCAHPAARGRLARGGAIRRSRRTSRSRPADTSLTAPVEPPIPPAAQRNRRRGHPRRRDPGGLLS
jgi:hypothetical protein